MRTDGTLKRVRQRPPHTVLTHYGQQQAGRIVSGKRGLFPGRHGSDGCAQEPLDRALGQLRVSAEVGDQLTPVDPCVPVKAGAVKAGEAHHPGPGRVVWVEVIDRRKEVHLHRHPVRGESVGDLAGGLQSQLGLFGKHTTKESDVRRTGLTLVHLDEVPDQLALNLAVGQGLPVVEQGLRQGHHFGLAQIEQDSGSVALGFLVQLAGVCRDELGQHPHRLLLALARLDQSIPEQVDQVFGSSADVDASGLGKDRRGADRPLDAL